MASTQGVGTPLWMAPEIFLETSSNYGPKVDVYSYGIIMWELAMRAHPWSEFDHLTYVREDTLGIANPGVWCGVVWCGVCVWGGGGSCERIILLLLLAESLLYPTHAHILTPVFKYARYATTPKTTTTHLLI